MSEPIELVLKRMSASDRHLLQISLHMNPIFVANADGNYSFREQSAMAQSVRQLMSEPAYRPLIPLAGQRPISEASLRVLMAEYGGDLDGYLEKLGDLLSVLPDDVVRAYREFTMSAIVNVAEASRDGFFGLVGDKISDEEKLLIRKMIQKLSLEPGEEQRAKLGMSKDKS